MPDLRVDHASLDAAQVSLQRLGAEFEGLEARRDEMAPLWVGRRVRRSMEGFADDWDRHRRELVESIHDLEKMVATIQETFAGVDEALSRSLTVTEVPAGGGS